MNNASLLQPAINDYLAKGVPELTRPMGGHEVDVITGIDLVTLLDNTNDEAWHHSDMKDRPYLETYALFDAWKDVINSLSTNSSSGN